MPRVPAARREAGAQINHAVAGQLAVTEALRLVEHLLPRLQRPVRLDETERPERWKVRLSGDAGIFAEDLRRLVGNDDKGIEESAACPLRRHDAGTPLTDLDDPERTAHIEPPAVRADHPGDRDARTLGIEV